MDIDGSCGSHMRTAAWDCTRISEIYLQSSVGSLGRSDITYMVLRI